MNQSLPVSVKAGSLLNLGDGSVATSGADVERSGAESGFGVVMTEVADPRLSGGQPRGEALPVDGDSLPVSDSKPVASEEGVVTQSVISAESETKSEGKSDPQIVSVEQIRQGGVDALQEIASYRQADLSVGGRMLQSVGDPHETLSIQQRIDQLAASQEASNTTVLSDSQAVSNADRSGGQLDQNVVAKERFLSSAGRSEVMAGVAVDVKPLVSDGARVSESLVQTSKPLMQSVSSTPPVAASAEEVVQAAHSQSLLAAVQQGNEQLVTPAKNAQQEGATKGLDKAMPFVTAVSDKSAEVATVSGSLIRDSEGGNATLVNQPQVQSKVNNTEQQGVQRTDTMPTSGSVVEVMSGNASSAPDVMTAAPAPQSTNPLVSGGTRESVLAESVVTDRQPVSAQANKTAGDDLVRAATVAINTPTQSSINTAVTGEARVGAELSAQQSADSQRMAIASDPGRASVAGREQLLSTAVEQSASTARTEGRNDSFIESLAASLSPTGARAQTSVSEPQLMQMPTGLKPGVPAWNQAINERIMMLSSQNGRFAEIQLDPPELGSLQVKLQIKNDQVSVVFNTPHAAVKDALEQGLPRLREMFEEQGLQLADSSVEDHSGGQQDSREEASGTMVSGAYDGEPVDEGSEVGDMVLQDAVSLVDVKV